MHIFSWWRLDCLAGHVRLELRNVVANYPFERSHRFPEIQPNSGHGDYSRLSCGAGDTQLGPRTKISARILRGRWSTGRYLFQLAPSGAGFFSLRIPEFESADPGILNSPVVMCANLRAPQSGSKSLPQLHIHHAAAQT